MAGRPPRVPSARPSASLQTGPAPPPSFSARPRFPAPPPPSGGAPSPPPGSPDSAWGRPSPAPGTGSAHSFGTETDRRSRCRYTPESLRPRMLPLSLSGHKRPKYRKNRQALHGACRFLAPPARLERTTFRLGGGPSIPVRYGGVWSLAWDKFHFNPKPPPCQRQLSPSFFPFPRKKVAFFLF